MKQLFSILLKRLCAFMLMLITSASTLFAYDFYVGGIYYEYGESNVYVTHGDQKYSGSIVIPPSININGKTLPVIRVTYDAFRDCNELTSVSLPNSIESILNNAFEGCTNLVSIPFPSELKGIGYRAFKGCTKLESIALPEGFTGLSGEAFMNCISLKKIVFPPRVKRIPEGAFSGCTGLLSIILGDSIQFIDKNAFYGCTSLTALFIPKSVKEIGVSAFENCIKVETLVLEDSEAGLKINTVSSFKNVMPIEVYLGRVNCLDQDNYYENFGIKFSNTKVLAIGKYIETIEKKAHFNNSTWRDQVYNGNYDVIYAKSMPTFRYNNTTKIYSQLFVPIGSKEEFLANEYYKDFFNIIEMDVSEMWNGEFELPDIPDPDTPNPDPNYMKCDVNGDGEVNIADINTIIEAILSH